MKPNPCVVNHASQPHPPPAARPGTLNPVGRACSRAAWASPAERLGRSLAPPGGGWPWELCLAATLWGMGLTALAATRYVDLNNPTPAAPYTSWATAARVIQDAVHAAAAGDEIVVTNGTYATGGRALAGSPLMTNRVAIHKAVTVRSVNGPLVTVIAGQPGIRCVYVGADAVLSGFALTNGRTRIEGGDDKERCGGGAWCEWSGVLTNCALRGNSAWSGGGAYGGTLNNCIVYDNMALLGGANYNWDSSLADSCTTPLPSGPGNIVGAPLFVDTHGWSNLRLRSNSPCINAGNNADVVGATDLDGLPRISGGTVDMGAYEFQPLDPFHAWLGQYGLPTDGSADFTDSDGDGHHNSQEWIAGSDPTDARSVLRMLSANGVASGVTVSWSSVANRTYALEMATDLGAAPAFSLLRSDLTGLPGTTTWTDTNAVGTAPRFYRVRVE